MVCGMWCMLEKMKIEKILGDDLYYFKWDYVDSNMFVLMHNHEALIIDPNDGQEGRNFLLSQDINTVTVMVTHEHFDHIIGIPWIREHYKCRVIASRTCGERMTVPSKNLSNRCDVLVNFNKRLSQTNNLRKIDAFVCEADEVFDENMTMEWFGHIIKIVSTPGHSAGSVCIVLDERYMFTGDTLLADYETITRLPSGSKKLFYDYTIPLIQNFTKVNKMYPGHGGFILK